MDDRQWHLLCMKYILKLTEVIQKRHTHCLRVHTGMELWTSASGASTEADQESIIFCGDQVHSTGCSGLMLQPRAVSTDDGVSSSSTSQGSHSSSSHSSSTSQGSHNSSQASTSSSSSAKTRRGPCLPPPTGALLLQTLLGSDCFPFFSIDSDAAMHHLRPPKTHGNWRDLQVCVSVLLAQ